MIQKKIVLSMLLAVVLAGCNRSPASYVAKGNQFAAQGKYEDAMIQYRNAIQKNPNYTDAYYRIGLAEMEQGQFALAYPAFKRASDLIPGRSEAAVRVGELAWWIYNADKRPAPALYNDLLQVSQKLLAVNPQDFDGIRFKAEVALADKRSDDALVLLQQANSMRPLYPDVIMPMAELLASKGQGAQAEQLLRQMLDHNPTYTSGYDALYRFYMGQKRVSEAEAVLRLRVQRNPKDTNALLQLAEHYGRQQNLAALNQTIQQLRDHRASMPGARMALAEFYAIHKDPEESLREFQQAIQEDPKNEIAYRKKMVTVLLSEGKRDQAEANLDQILKRDPNDAEARRVKAGFDLTTRQQQKVSDAVGIYKDLSAKQPNNSDLRFYYARALLASGDVRTARAELTAAIQRNPASMAPKLALAGLEVNQGQYPDALQLTTAVLDQNPANETARMLHAVTLAGLGQRQSARADLNRLLRDHPDSEDAELQLGLLDVAEKQYPEATKIFSKYYHAGQADPRPLEGLIRSDVTQGQFDKALGLLDAEVQKAPKSNDLRLMLASVATGAGKFEVAEAQYRAMSSESDSGGLELQWADLEHARRDVPGAIEHYRKAKALDPKNSAAAALLGRELEDAGRTPEAIASYRDALKADPKNVFVLNNLAFLLAESGRNLDEALQMALSAQKLIKDNVAVADTVGWVYLKKGLTGSALQVFQNNVRKEPKNPTYRYHLGAALLASGDKIKAKQELEKALQNSPSHEQEPEIRGLLAKIS
ncbi:MAG: tetratricopeptide repeat protein [Bryobacteraceae bacterium]